MLTTLLRCGAPLGSMCAPLGSMCALQWEAGTATSTTGIDPQRPIQRTSAEGLGVSTAAGLHYSSLCAVALQHCAARLARRFAEGASCSPTVRPWLIH